MGGGGLRNGGRPAARAARGSRSRSAAARLAHASGRLRCARRASIGSSSRRCGGGAHVLGHMCIAARPTNQRCALLRCELLCQLGTLLPSALRRAIPPPPPCGPCSHSHPSAPPAPPTPFDAPFAVGAARFSSARTLASSRVEWRAFYSIRVICNNRHHRIYPRVKPPPNLLAPPYIPVHASSSTPAVQIRLRRPRSNITYVCRCGQATRSVQLGRGEPGDGRTHGHDAVQRWAEDGRRRNCRLAMRGCVGRNTGMDARGRPARWRRLETKRLRTRRMQTTHMQTAWPQSRRSLTRRAPVGGAATISR